MGQYMARNLHRAGMLSAVWNRSADKAKRLAAELNVAAPATLEQLAAGVDAVNELMRVGFQSIAASRRSLTTSAMPMPTPFP